MLSVVFRLPADREPVSAPRLTLGQGLAPAAADAPRRQRTRPGDSGRAPATADAPGLVQQGTVCREYGGSAGFFERALALDPGDLDALLGTAAVDTQVATGYQTDDRPVRLAAAEATLTKVLSQSPNNAWAHYLMCRVEVQSKRGAQGIAECERALALNPNLAAAHAQLVSRKYSTVIPRKLRAMNLTRCASVPTIRRPVSG